jgi:hypothetical protein
MAHIPHMMDLTMSPNPRLDGEGQRVPRRDWRPTRNDNDFGGPRFWNDIGPGGWPFAPFEGWDFRAREA